MNAVSENPESSNAIKPMLGDVRINQKYSIHKCYVRFSNGFYEYPSTHDSCCTECAVKFREKHKSLSIIEPRSFISEYGSRTNEGMVDRYLTKEDLEYIEKNNKFPFWAGHRPEIEYDKDNKPFINHYDHNEVKFGGNFNCNNCNKELSPNPNIGDLDDDYI